MRFSPRVLRYDIPMALALARKCLTCRPYFRFRAYVHVTKI